MNHDTGIGPALLHKIWGSTTSELLRLTTGNNIFLFIFCRFLGCFTNANTCQYTESQPIHRWPTFFLYIYIISFFAHSKEYTPDSSDMHIYIYTMYSIIDIAIAVYCFFILLTPYTRTPKCCRSFSIWNRNWMFLFSSFFLIHFTVSDVQHSLYSGGETNEM